MSDETPDPVMTGERLDALERWRADIEKRFADAFPGADHVGHCRYHQLMIEDLAERKKLRQAVMEKTVAGLIWAIVMGLAIATWQYIVKSVRGV
jgi:hypothetical protein